MQWEKENGLAAGGPIQYFISSIHKDMFRYSGGRKKQKQKRGTKSTKTVFKTTRFVVEVCLIKSNNPHIF